MSVPVSCTGMDFITLENKMSILGHKAERPAENIFFNPAREQPLFWAERKSTNLWIALLKDLKIKTGVVKRMKKEVPPSLPSRFFLPPRRRGGSYYGHQRQLGGGQPGPSREKFIVGRMLNKYHMKTADETFEFLHWEWYKCFKMLAFYDNIQQKSDEIGKI